MKIDPLFKDCLADVALEIRSEVRLNMDIANRIYDILQEKNMTQREFAALMGKCESEISRSLTVTTSSAYFWMSGTVMSPGALTAMPSAMVATESVWT